MIYCVANVKQDKFIVGDTLSDIIPRVFDISLVNRQLIAKAKGYAVVRYHSYNDEYTDSEMYNDVLKFLVGKLPDYGWELFTKRTF